MQLQTKGWDVTDEEIRISLSALLVGGNITTTDLIGNGVRLLLKHPDQLELLKACPELARRSIQNR